MACFFFCSGQRIYLLEKTFEGQGSHPPLLKKSVITGTNVHRFKIDEENKFIICTHATGSLTVSSFAGDRIFSLDEVCSHTCLFLACSPTIVRFRDTCLPLHMLNTRMAMSYSMGTWRMLWKYGSWIQERMINAATLTLQQMIDIRVYRRAWMKTFFLLTHHR